MIVNAGYRGKVAGAAPKFTYTGQYNIRKDGVVELLTSGTLMFLNPAVIDIFCVGGGGGGTSKKTGINTNGGFGGGGGGYTVTKKNCQISGSHIITIGAGGAAMKNGGATSFGNVLTAQGGTSHTDAESHNIRRNGCDGGSGGGAGVLANSDYGAGGGDGGNGESGFPTSVNGGNGQGSSTREFGDPNGKLYAGGGGGGRYISGSKAVVSLGGSGGGGTGGWYGSSGVSHPHQAAAAGGANTGGGGGGGAQDSDGNATPGASGGSGIVCFRDAAPLPELSGTWVLNRATYGLETELTEYVSFTINYSVTGDTYSITRVIINSTSTKFLQGNTPILSCTNGVNAWNGTVTLTFPAGATASDEFRAWLASNATKQ